jgi:tetratricopeptide (TPR) repeat protein
MAMGQVLAKHHKHGEAITSFVKATNLKLDDVLAHFRTGNSYYELNAIVEAQNSYERALQGDRNTPGEAGNDLLAQVRRSYLWFFFWAH